MALDITVTLKRQIAEFSEWASAHPMVNDFGYGQYLESFRSSENKYLAIVVNSPSATSEDFFINYSWEIICLDYVLDEKSNRDRVNSDTMDVLRDLENTIRYSNHWQNFSRVDGNWSYRKVDEFGADKCFGWIATFTLKIKKKHGICDITSLMPTYDFETGTVVYPSCDPVAFLIEGVNEDTFASGTDFDLTIVNQLGATPVYSYDDVLKKLTVQTGGGSCDIELNSTPFLSGQSGTVDIPVLNMANDPIGVENPLGTWKIGNAEVQILNSNSTYDEIESVVAEGAAVHNLPDITVTDSDGSSSAYPSAKNVTCTPMFPSSKLWKTGQTTSYAANDDGDLERGNGASFTTLSKNNYFGNTNRFTDVLGGQTYADDWVIDWSTWDKETGEYIMWYRVKQTGKTWANTISGQPYNLGGYSDCYIPNINELRSLYNGELTSAMNYAPINISASGGSANNLWSSTTVPTATTNALAFNDVVVEQSRAKTLVVQYIVLRIGNVSEL